MIRAETLEELLDASVLLSKQPLPRGRRVAVLTNAGGLGILAADACEAVGLELPDAGRRERARLAEFLPVEASVSNPVDMLGSATASTYEAVLPVLLEDHGVDAVLVLFVPPVTATADQVALAVAQAAARAEKPIVAAVMDARGIPSVLLEAGVASYGYPESAARALGRAAARAEWLRRPAGSIPTWEGSAVTARVGSSRPRSNALPTSGWIPTTPVHCSRPTESPSSNSAWRALPRKPPASRRSLAFPSS